MEGGKYNYRYFVLNRERRRLRNGSGCYDSEKISLEKSRVCLKCGMKFSSNSPYNRLCDKCTSKNSRIEYRAFRANSIHYHVEESNYIEKAEVCSPQRRKVRKEKKKQ